MAVTSHQALPGSLPLCDTSYAKSPTSRLCALLGRERRSSNRETVERSRRRRDQVARRAAHPPMTLPNRTQAVSPHFLVIENPWRLAHERREASPPLVLLYRIGVRRLRC